MLFGYCIASCTSCVHGALCELQSDSFLCLSITVQVPTKVAVSIRQVPAKVAYAVKALADGDDDKSKLVGDVFPKAEAS